jgi:hypothetical protein
MHKCINYLITTPKGFKASSCISIILLIYTYRLKVILNNLQPYDVLILTYLILYFLSPTTGLHPYDFIAQRSYLCLANLLKTPKQNIKSNIFNSNNLVKSKHPQESCKVFKPYQQIKAHRYNQVNLLTPKTTYPYSQANTST